MSPIERRSASCSVQRANDPLAALGDLHNDADGVLILREFDLLERCAQVGDRHHPLQEGVRRDDKAGVL